MSSVLILRVPVLTAVKGVNSVLTLRVLVPAVIIKAVTVLIVLVPAVIIKAATVLIVPRTGGYNQGGGYNRPYRPRTADYNPNAKYSLKKQIEYKDILTDPNEPIRLNKFLANAGICYPS